MAIAQVRHELIRPQMSRNILIAGSRYIHDDSINALTAAGYNLLVNSNTYYASIYLETHKGYSHIGLLVAEVEPGEGLRPEAKHGMNLGSRLTDKVLNENPGAKVLVIYNQVEDMWRVRGDQTNKLHSMQPPVIPRELVEIVNSIYSGRQTTRITTP